MDRTNQFIVLGSALAAIGVAAGAFGAHGLKRILEPEMLTIYETAVRYQMYHAFGIIVAGLLPLTARSKTAAWLFVAGIVLFSGSLYALTLSGVKVLGMVTPFGGVAFIAGWLLLALSLFKKGN